MHSHATIQHPLTLALSSSAAAAATAVVTVVVTAAVTAGVAASAPLMLPLAWLYAVLMILELARLGEPLLFRVCALMRLEAAR